MAVSIALAADAATIVVAVAVIIVSVVVRLVIVFVVVAVVVLVINGFPPLPKTHRGIVRLGSGRVVGGSVSVLEESELP